jgi:hypothetical protein
MESSIKEQILRRQKEMLDMKKSIDENKKICNEAMKFQFDQATQYETVSEICSNLTELLKIQIFKDNGCKESGFIAIRDKSAPYHESVGTIEYDNF